MNTAGRKRGDGVDNQQEQKDEPDPLLQFGGDRRDKVFDAVKDEPDHTGKNDGSN
jgi:hypothetical protein